MNQPPEQIALFGTRHRERVGQNRAPEPPKPEPRPQSFDPHRTHQLAMFMTPHEIQTHYSPLEGDRLDMDRWDGDISDDDDYADVETDDELWDRKAEEADESGLTESITKHGVLSPVQLAFSDKHGPRGAPEVLGGHHRVAAAPPHSLVPVLHYNNIRDARGDKAYSYERSVRKEDPEYHRLHREEMGFGSSSSYSEGASSGSGSSEPSSQAHPWIRNSRIP